MKDVRNYSLMCNPTVPYAITVKRVPSSTVYAITASRVPSVQYNLTLFMYKIENLTLSFILQKLSFILIIFWKFIFGNSLKGMNFKESKD